MGPMGMRISMIYRNVHFPTRPSGGTFGHMENASITFGHQGASWKMHQFRSSSWAPDDGWAYIYVLNPLWKSMRNDPGDAQVNLHRKSLRDSFGNQSGIALESSWSLSLWKLKEFNWKSRNLKMKGMKMKLVSLLCGSLVFLSQYGFFQLHFLCGEFCWFSWRIAIVLGIDPTRHSTVVELSSELWKCFLHVGYFDHC